MIIIKIILILAILAEVAFLLVITAISIPDFFRYRRAGKVGGGCQTSYSKYIGKKPEEEE
ncbi:hypothetical protein KKI24_22640 [bacterium]|nr:hypothetical protein [bacterium]